MLWALIAISVLFFALLIFLLFKQSALQKTLEKPKDPDNSLLMLQQHVEALREQVRVNLESSSNVLQKQLGDLNQQLNDRLRDSTSAVQQTHKAVGERLDNAARVVGELQGKLGKLEEANVRLFEVGKDIKSLQEILKAPKLRGNLGEFFLADLLAQILPRENFELQHAFRSNEKVDAVIRLGEQWVPVDAKFPLENFQRILATEVESERKVLRKAFVGDVKKHIDAIAQKYIRPDEGTFDFALMYVPAENVYYEVIVKDELSDGEHHLSQYAMKKRVIPVSPNTLYTYLNTIVLGLKGMHVEKAAKEILTGLNRLTGDLERIGEAFRKVGTHLSHAQGSFEDAQNRLGKFGEKMERLHGQEVNAEMLSESPEDKVRLLPGS